MIPLLVMAVNFEACDQKSAMHCLQSLLAETSPVVLSHLSELLKGCIKVAYSHKLMVGLFIIILLHDPSDGLGYQVDSH
jgi:hypothetical protein